MSLPKSNSLSGFVITLKQPKTYTFVGFPAFALSTLLSKFTPHISCPATFLIRRINIHKVETTAFGSPAGLEPVCRS